MQAGSATKRLSLSDIFAARGFSLRVFLARVCSSLTDHVPKSNTAELPSVCWLTDPRRVAA